MSAIKGNHMLSNGAAALLGLRITQLVVAVATLGLSAYGVYYLSFDGDNMTLFSSIATIIIVVYHFLATLSFPKLYNYWAILGLEILAVIFWVVSFPLLASQIANSIEYDSYDYYSSYDCTYSYDGYCYYKQKRGLELAKRATTTWYTYRNAMIATAALGGLEFLLFVATLVIIAIGISRHRKNGGHCVPGTTQTQAAPVHEVQETV